MSGEDIPIRKRLKTTEQYQLLSASTVHPPRPPIYPCPTPPPLPTPRASRKKALNISEGRDPLQTSSLTRPRAYVCIPSFSITVVYKIYHAIFPVFVVGCCLIFMSVAYFFLHGSSQRDESSFKTERDSLAIQLPSSRLLGLQIWLEAKSTLPLPLSSTPYDPAQCLHRGSLLYGYTV